MSDVCCRCEKPLTARQVERGWWVRLDVAGQIVPPAADLPESRDLGWFPLGSDCARRVPADCRVRAEHINYQKG